MPAAGRLPLSALRVTLDEGSARTRWLLHPDGVLGRVLLVPAGATFTVPLKLSGEASFSARAMLLPHDWRDGRDAVRASVAVIDALGRGSEIWSGTLRASDRGRPRGLPVECRLPAFTRALQLNVQARGALRPSSVARAIWVEPAITDPYAPPLPDRPPGPPARQPERRPGATLISVLTPVHDPPPQMLEASIASVRGQTFTDWELCLVDDGSTNPEVIAALKRHAAEDSRIHVERRDQAGGISTATNAALDLATGRYIALLDHDDTLTPDALQHVADKLAEDPDLDMIYSDEDVIRTDGIVEHHLKPGWSPEHMSALMYTCHLGVYRRQLALDLGGFRSQFDGCQDYDFVLRLMERTDRVTHIPRILYHWRAHSRSTAGGDVAKPYAYLAQPNAIADHLERSGVDAEVQFAHLPGLHRVVHRVRPSTNVDLVLAIDDPRGLAQAAASWVAQPHPSWSVVLAASAGALDAAIAELTSAGISDARITTVTTEPGEDPASALAAAAGAATAEHLVLMQAAAMGLTHDWLTRLIGYSIQPRIAAAGPVVLTSDGRIQHAGVAIPDGIPLYLHYGSRASAALPVVCNLSAVSGVFATSRDTYRELGGLNPEFKDLALIDYCLRATDSGQRVVIVPDSRVRATGPYTATNDLPTIWRLRQNWAITHGQDPYYGPNYLPDRGDFIPSRYG